METNMITVRLEPQLEQTVTTLSHQMGISKSEFMRKSITAFIDSMGQPSPWALGNTVFGKYESGQDNLSTDRKRLVKEKIEAKR